MPRLTLNLLTTTIVAPPSNASKWQMGFNSAFKGLNAIFTDRCLTCRVFKRLHPTLGSEFLTAYHEVLQILRMKKHNLKQP